MRFPGLIAMLVTLAAAMSPAEAQNAPTREEIAVYAGLHEAAAKGDVAEIERLIKAGEKPNLQDSKSRTPLLVAAHLKQTEAVRTLLKLGANANAMDIDQYDIVTIAAVANDLPTLKAALDGIGLVQLLADEAAPHIARKRLVPVLEAWKPPGAEFSLYYPSRRQMPLVLQAFIDFLRKDGLLVGGKRR